MPTGHFFLKKKEKEGCPAPPGNITGRQGGPGREETARDGPHYSKKITTGG